MSVFKWQHAEMNALIGCRKNDLSRATIYVARVSPGGNVRIAKPCEDCQRILRAAGVNRVVYTDRDGRPRKMKL